MTVNGTLDTTFRDASRRADVLAPFSYYYVYSAGAETV
jgi:hypothetical protein